MKLHKMDTAQESSFSPFEALAAQSAHLQQKYLGGQRYPPPSGLKDFEKGEFTIQSIDVEGGATHGVPLSSLSRSRTDPPPVYD